ncbi:hypothetical protein EVAR_20102_1 [Eumeta japonica]|uniref:Uncharacterized protein n=1 Tax=Eumeta variegata TaxID=151549 RepID=A0A4C1V3W5_EUMVA|nr:hypothetical protein EVAR_20102_1 [Eumeta japonica]
MTAYEQINDGASTSTAEATEAMQVDDVVQTDVFYQNAMSKSCLKGWTLRTPYRRRLLRIKTSFVLAEMKIKDHKIIVSMCH